MRNELCHLRDSEAWGVHRAGQFLLKADLDVPDECLQAARRRVISVEEARRVHPAATEALPQQGTFHRLFRAGPGRVLRLNAAGELFRDHAMHLDAWVAERLDGVPLLSPLHVDTSRHRADTDFQLLPASPWPSCADLPGPPQPQLLGEWGSILARVHCVRLEGNGPLDARTAALGGSLRGLHERWSDFIRLRLDSHLEQCQALAALSEPQADDVRRYFRRHVDLLDGVEPCLLHGDPGPGNVLTDGAAVCGLIDWEDALAGDLVFDVAGWAAFQPRERHAAFLAGYRRVRPLPGDFAPRFWLYFLRIALARTVVRHRLGLPACAGGWQPSLRIQLSLGELRRLEKRRQAA